MLHDVLDQFRLLLWIGRHFVVSQITSKESGGSLFLGHLATVTREIWNGMSSDMFSPKLLGLQGKAKPILTKSWPNLFRV